MFEGKRILIGITASIAAYKITFLVRLLKKEGAEVKVVMTPAAHDFVTPLSLATLSGNPVLSDFTVDEKSGEWTNHVELGLWADVMLIAPATANSMSKMASGEADNFLLACYLSAKCPVLVAPAMDRDMYKHGSTKNNLDKLSQFGNTIIPAESGELASGLHGEGRMAEPETLLNAIRICLYPSGPLMGKRILISAGPTFEAIDPIRFLGNRSTGKMGFRLAEEAVKKGAEVILVCGPSHEQLDTTQLERIDIQSAQEMYDAILSKFDLLDVVIMAAAVADYTPADYSNNKLKKADGQLKIELKRTKDILGHLGEIKRDDQVLVGFALETNDALENAKSKLKRKHLDFIVLNSLENKGAGFGVDSNQITILDSNNNMINFELKSKAQVALDILNTLENYYEKA